MYSYNIHVGSKVDILTSLLQCSYGGGGGGVAMKLAVLAWAKIGISWQTPDLLLKGTLIAAQWYCISVYCLP